MRFFVNDVEHHYSGDGERTLLEYLRRDLGITSPKDGCSPQAACGCCTVELDQKGVLACVTPMKKVADKRVRTIEGLPTSTQETFADSFATCGGAQCGFCIPGIVMRSAILVEQNPSPTDPEIERALIPHLCRCTGYKKIVESIRTAAETLRGGPTPEAERTGRVGSRLPKIGTRDVTLGRRPYVADMTRPGQMHGALRLSDHPRARVLSIDVTEAAALPGVTRIFTAADVPGQRSIGLIVADWPLMVAVGEFTRCVGDVIACVAAESRDIAMEAARRIDVDYEIFPPVTDPEDALTIGAPPIHAGGNQLSATVIHKGDAKTALTSSTFVAEATYETQRIEHGFMEPEACLAEPSPGGVTVYSQSQGVYEDQRQIALLLGVDQESVRVVLVPNGGGFGGKEDLSVQGHTALMATLLQRPVHLELTREQSLLLHPKRHPIRMHYRVGCDDKGRLTAVHARMIGDTGAYASVGMKVLERAAGHSTGAYDVPNVDVRAVAAYTNNVPCGAMRGFGANQANFAMECAIDELCEQGGFDRWKFRYDNALVEGGTTATGQRLSSGVGVRATLDAVRDAFYAASHVGIACGLKNTGIGNGMPDSGTAKIVIRSADQIELHHGWTEMGQGVDTMAVQTFCEETGLPPQIVSVHVDTDAATPCGMTTASRATSLVGNAVIDACRQLRRDLAQHTVADLVGREYRGEWTCNWTTKPGKEDGKPIITHYSYSYATQVVIANSDGDIEKVIAAHDAGRVMNPTLFEGQIEGSVHMGLGYALTEDFPMEGGRPVSTRLRKCGILRAHETPAIEVIGVEVPDEFGPYGVKGVGEIGLVPTAPAVANALYQVDGIRRRTLPMRPR